MDWSALPWTRPALWRRKRSVLTSARRASVPCSSVALNICRYQFSLNRLSEASVVCSFLNFDGAAVEFFLLKLHAFWMHLIYHVKCAQIFYPYPTLFPFPLLAAPASL